jgi:hypothetical protein
MILKVFWEKCPTFVVEEEDAFFVEASAEETERSIFPQLSPQEKIKFEQLKDVYVAKKSDGLVREGCYYFLVSRDAHMIKFESVEFMTSDLSARGGKARVLPDIPIERIDDIDTVSLPEL